MTKAHKCHYERILNAIQCMYITPEHLTLLDLVPFKSMIFQHSGKIIDLKGSIIKGQRGTT